MKTNSPSALGRLVVNPYKDNQRCLIRLRRITSTNQHELSRIRKFVWIGEDSWIKNVRDKLSHCSSKKPILFSGILNYAFKLFFETSQNKNRIKKIQQCKKASQIENEG
jgi:hypothetical protein